MTYGPPTANEHLRQSVQNSINYVNRAPLFVPDGVETGNEIVPGFWTRLIKWMRSWFW